MNTNTDKLFEEMRKMPPEIPVESVEKFVLAQAAVGITAVAASKGIFTKLAFIKFHLNTIIIMTSIATVSIIGALAIALHGPGDKLKNHRPEFKSKIGQKHFFQSNDKLKDHFFTKHNLGFSLQTMAVDTPQVNTVQSVQNGQPVSVTTIQTENGTNIKVVTSSNNAQAKVYYNIKGDSSYTYAYATPAVTEAIASTDAIEAQQAKTDMALAAIDQQLAAIDAQRAMLEAQAEMLQANADMAQVQAEMNAEKITNCCAQINCHTDSLIPKLEKALLKDGLISDTLHYSFKINGSYMKVNGEKVSKDVWKKYKEFIEANSANRIHHAFSLAIMKDGDDTTMNMENYVN